MSAPPPSPGMSGKPHYAFPGQPSKTRNSPSKSHSTSVCKTLSFLILLLAIPFFPSRAPDFIAETAIFSQFWEIIHLVFIGIAVSYGLFCRRAEIEISRFDDADAYLSGISRLSSVFEDGFGNVCCGPDSQELDVMQGYFADCQCFGDQFLGKSKCVIHGGSSSSRKIRSFVPKKRSENITRFGNGENVMNQTWSSKHSKTESLVVVSKGENVLNSILEYKPLNLPVRSLRSNVIENFNPEILKKDDVSPKIEAKCKHDVKAKKIRGTDPTELDEPDGSSSIPWRSRSGSMQDKDELCNIKPNAHCSPHSIGEFEFNHVKPRSKKVSKFSSSAELETSRVEKTEEDEVIPVPCPEITPSKDETLFSSSTARPFNVGNSSCGEDKLGKGKQPIESFDSDVKSSALAKALSKAKSVRTKKLSTYVVNGKEQSSSQIDAELHRMCNDWEDKSFEKKGKWEEPKKSLVKHEEKEIGGYFSMEKPKPYLPDFFGDEKEDMAGQNVTDSEEECGDNEESEFDEACDEGDAKTNIDFDLGSEVDRKAGEFIAKFREQIRLQKASSVDGSNREFL